MNSKINISVSSQKLSLFQEGELISSYKVSTALKGVGQEKNSFGKSYYSCHDWTKSSNLCSNKS